MTSKQKIFTVIIAALFSSECLAFFCPSNFKEIETGDSLAQVEAKCGPADSVSKSAAPIVGPQEWTYYLVQPTMRTSWTAAGIGSNKTTFLLDAGGKVINITVNGLSTGTTNNCSRNVSLNDSRKSVERACGAPTSIVRLNAAPSNEDNNLVQMRYNSTPPVTLIFQYGILIDKK
jgi:hypothetical protein